MKICELVEKVGRVMWHTYADNVAISLSGLLTNKICSRVTKVPQTQL